MPKDNSRHLPLSSLVHPRTRAGQAARRQNLSVDDHFTLDLIKNHDLSAESLRLLAKQLIMHNDLGEVVTFDRETMAWKAWFVFVVHELDARSYLTFFSDQPSSPLPKRDHETRLTRWICQPRKLCPTPLPSFRKPVPLRMSNDGAQAWRQVHLPGDGPPLQLHW